MNVKLIKNLSLIAMSIVVLSCGSGEPKKQEASKKESIEQKQESFEFLVEKFADLKIMRYQVPGFENLLLNQKKLVYYLSQAAVCGRDIIFDQNFKHNLAIRRTLEGIYQSYSGDKSAAEYTQFVEYLKRVWFSNGIHHHYSTDKFFPDFSKEYFAELVKNSNAEFLPLQEGETVDVLIEKLTPIIFDENIAPKRVNQAEGVDMVQESATNFYENITQKEVEEYYAAQKAEKDERPISYGLNSKLMKEDGKIVEKKYKIGGMYSQAIEKIVYWLEKALSVAENNEQKTHIQTLIKYYQTGDLKIWDEYNVQWVQDIESHVDYVNGFIENYGDPMGMKSTWESVVDFKNIEATKRTQIISDNAQWFEDHSPVDDKFKKKEVKGVSAKVINTAMVGGDCYPSTPIGINLPNADWIRKEYGSKSVTMDNITYAYEQVSMGSGMLEEFVYSEEERALIKKWGPLSGNLHTDLHECLGHGSGQLLPGVSSEALKNYASPLEEARADLFALYFLYDQKMIDIGLIESVEVAKAEYSSYIRNGLMTQLTRIKLGKEVEQAHMRNRQLIAKWCFDKGQKDNVIEKIQENGKTYFVVNDYEKLRTLFGELLKEVQRIKSEGDFEAGKALIENYAVKVDPELHKEVLDRYAKLNLAPYGGFINPTYVPVKEDGEIIDIKVEYKQDFIEQNIDYSTNYSYLPTYN